jgi:glycosyltransferase involved in cell wall biosynthesis
MALAAQHPSLVSIVVPTYSRPVFLERALASIYAQTYANWELIVVDDNHPDSEARRETEALMARHSRATYLRHEQNRGGSATRNTGIKAARGDFVAFLDDDDEWLPEKLEKQMAVFVTAEPKVALVYTGARHVYADERHNVVREPTLAGEVLIPLIRENVIGTTSTVVCRREALLAIGMFDETLPASQDYDLFFRLAQRYQFAVVPEALTLSHRHGEGNIGSNVAGKVLAYTTFYCKHQATMAAHPEAHLAHLKWMARYFVRHGYRQEAAQALRAARGIRRLEAELMALELMNRLGDKTLAQIWRLRRRVLDALSRPR